MGDSSWETVQREREPPFSDGCWCNKSQQLQTFNQFETSFEIWEKIVLLKLIYALDNGIYPKAIYFGLDWTVQCDSPSPLFSASCRSSRLGQVWIGRLVSVVPSRLWRWWFRARARPPVSCRSYLTGSLSSQVPVSSSCRQRCPTARCSASSSPPWPPLPHPHQAQVW